jgi:hypothetical protein
MHYYGSIEGKTVKSVSFLTQKEIDILGWTYTKPDNTTVITFTDDTFAIVGADPEMNGPGHLDIYAK